MITADPVDHATLDRRASLRYPTSSRDSVGGDVSAWMVGARVWSKWMPKSSREFISAQAEYATLTALLRMRYRTDIQATWRVVIAGVNYEVIGKPREIGRREYLDVPLQTIATESTVDDRVRQVFNVPLSAGLTEKAILFPEAFSSVPGANPQLTPVVPAGGTVFTPAVRAGSLTALGFTAEWTTPTPTTGYGLSVDVTQ